MAVALAAGRPWVAVVGTVPVPVSVVAMPPRPIWGGGLDGGVDHRHRLLNRGVGCPQLTQPRELEKAGVDDGALVERRPPIAEVVRNCGVGVAGLRKADEV